MAIELSTAARDAMNDALAGLVDAGTDNAGGRMVVYSDTSAVLAIFEFPDPAFGGGSTGGVLTLDGGAITSSALATGIAATFEVQDRDEDVVYSGTVGEAGSGADAIIDTTSITSGDTVRLNSHVITAPGV